MLYAGAGGGFGFVGGATTEEGCNSETSDCAVVPGSTAIGFGYGRLGVSHGFGRERRHMLSLDGGVWYGVQERHVENQLVSQERILWPLAGLAFHYAL